VCRCCKAHVRKIPERIRQHELFRQTEQEDRQPLWPPPSFFFTPTRGLNAIFSRSTAKLRVCPETLLGPA
jgi:hypothetical protein